MASAGAGASDGTGFTLLSFLNCCTPMPQAGGPGGSARPKVMTPSAAVGYVACARARPQAASRVAAGQVQQALLSPLRSSRRSNPSRRCSSHSSTQKQRCAAQRTESGASA